MLNDPFATKFHVHHNKRDETNTIHTFYCTHMNHRKDSRGAWTIKTDDQIKGLKVKKCSFCFR